MPAKQSTLDHEFWPVLVALTVLCSIGLGAIITILRGAWMWGSLFLLPLLALGAIVFLFNIDSQKLRRSLQLAIILSLAVHLMVLVFASVINIFQNPFKPNERQVAQQKQVVRTIEISDQRASFVWEEPNSRETPEPTVEPEKEQRPTTNLKPQIIPVKDPTPEILPQIVRNEKTAQSIPKQAPEMSELRSQPRKEVQPLSSQKAVGQQTVKQKTPAKPNKPDTSVESSKQAKSITREPVKATEAPAASASKAAAAPDRTVKPEQTAKASARRAKPDKTSLEAAPMASSSKARVRASKPDLPKATTKAVAAEKIASASTAKRSALQPSKTADSLTRRSTKSPTVKPAMTNKPKTLLSPKAQVARSTRKTKPNLAQPSISTKTSVTLSPRRAATNAEVASTPVKIEQPSRQPESKTASRDLKSKTLSVSKSTEGVAGIGRAKNLDRYTGGMNTPAVRASDAASRERAMSSSKSTRMLSASQKSQVRRTVGATLVPTSVFKAETSNAAKIAGTKSPSERTAESSAAQVDSRTASTKDEMSAEKGSSSVDLGPTKIVMDGKSQRRSGGGQPEVSKLDPDSTRRSRDASDVQPSLVAAIGMDTIAPRNQSAMEASVDAVEASEQATFAARTGGESSVTAETWASEVPGELSNQGQSDSAEQFADQRKRANRSKGATTWDADEDDDEDEENLRGTRDTRIARAPVVNSDAGFGTAQADGRSAAKPNEAGDSPTESLATKIQRQATSSIPGSGLGQAAANALLSAATSLPIIESTSNRRSGSGDSKKSNLDPTKGLAESDTKNTRSMQPSLAPTVTGTATIEPSESGTATAAPTAPASADSAVVSVERSSIDSMEQVQGSQLDIDAIEGPAGLGARPDNFVGVMTRPASKDSKQLQPDFKNRFKNRDFGGVPSINPEAAIAKKAFKSRSPAALSAVSEPTTEAAIQLGLKFLAKHQSPDGSWSLTGFDRDAPQHLTQLDSDTAATGLALLAFQGAGYNHVEFKYAKQIDNAIKWMIENQTEDGGLYVQTNNKSDNACRLYSHGIAALALTESYGMTQDPTIKVAAQRALDYISSSQDDKKGGWRYFDTPGKKSSDTSVSGWMMMALQSGRLAGLNVDDKCFDGVDNWLEVAADPENPSVYRYNPYAVDSKGVSRIQGRKPTTTMTSVGLLMRIYSGWKRKDPRLLVGADYLLTQLPSDTTLQSRDTYYWYYATQVLKHVDGPRWEKWNNALRPLLTRSQEKDGELAGSWHPYKPVPDRWGAFGGRIYVTSMNLLSLEVRHRMLPLYQQSGPPTIAGVIETIPAAKDPAREKTENVTTRSDSNVPKRRPDKRRPKAPAANPDLAMREPPAKRLVKKPALKPAIKPESKIEADIRPRTKPSASPSMPKVSSDIAVVPVPTPKQPNQPKAVAADVTPKLPRVSKSDLPKTKIAKPESTKVAEPKLQPKIGLSKPNPTKQPKQPKNSLPELADTSVPPRKVAPPKVLPSLPKPKAAPKLSSKAPPTVKPTIEPVTPKAVQPKPLKPASVKPKPIALYSAVAGKITLDSAALANAKIEFIPVDGKGEKASTRSDQNGRFTFKSLIDPNLKGLKAGDYKVSITTFRESSDANVIDFLETVPEKYNSKTTLKATVTPGAGVNLNFNLVQ